MDATGEWKPIPGFESHYAINEFGVVKRTAPGRRTRPGRIQRPGPHRDGYSIVQLFIDGRGFTRLVHRLVAEAFVGPAPEGKRLVRHLDGDPHNNHYSNLAWGNQSENWADATFHRENGVGVAAPR